MLLSSWVYAALHQIIHSNDHVLDSPQIYSRLLDSNTQCLSLMWMCTVTHKQALN